MTSETTTFNNDDHMQSHTATEEHRHTLQSSLERKIRDRAHEIYMARGAEPGHEVQDWLQAECELTA
jgi:hypothetical protein